MSSEISLSEKHRCSSVEIMAIPPELDQWKREIYIMWYTGEFFSILGFLLLILTAYTFPPWRRTDQTKAWIQLCFAYLLFTLIYVNFKDFKYCMHPAHIVACIYVGQATFCWMLAVAWLAYKRLVVVFSEDDDGFILRAALFSWLSPLPCDAMRLSLDVVQFPDILFHKDASKIKVKIGRCKMSMSDVVQLIDYFRDVGMYLPVLTPITCSVIIYGYVLALLCKNRKMWKTKQDVIGTAAISMLFMLMSGIQFVFVVFSRFFTFTRFDLLLGFLISYKVFINSVLFLVAIKKTRLMWWAYLRLKLCGIREERFCISDVEIS